MEYIGRTMFILYTPGLMPARELCFSLHERGQRVGVDSVHSPKSGCASMSAVRNLAGSKRPMYTDKRRRQATRTSQRERATEPDIDDDEALPPTRRRRGAPPPSPQCLICTAVARLCLHIAAGIGLGARGGAYDTTARYKARNEHHEATKVGPGRVSRMDITHTSK